MFRIYVNAYGQLHFIDLSIINVMNGTVVQVSFNLVWSDLRI